jgi:hypothetical protein
LLICAFCERAQLIQSLAHDWLVLFRDRSKFIDTSLERSLFHKVRKSELLGILSRGYPGDVTFNLRAKRRDGI